MRNRRMLSLLLAFIMCLTSSAAFADDDAQYSKIDFSAKKPDVTIIDAMGRADYYQWHSGEHGKNSPPSALFDGVRYNAGYWQLWQSYTSVNRYTESRMPIDITIDFGASQVLSKMEYTEIGKIITSMVVQASDDGQSWTDVKNLTFSADGSKNENDVEIVFDTLLITQYVRFRIQGGVGSGFYSISEMEFFEPAFLGNITKSVITDEELNSITENIKPLPSEIAGYPIIWESSDTTVLNPQTSEVRRGKEDKQVALTAIVDVDGKVVKKSFQLTVLAKDLYSQIDSSIVNSVLCYSVLQQNFYWQWNTDDGIHGKNSPPSALFDGVRYNAEYWQKWVAYTTADKFATNLPITFSIALDKPVILTRLDYTEIYKSIGEYEILVSEDNENWTSVVQGAFDDLSLVQSEYDRSIVFAPQKAQYVKFVIKSLQTSSGSVIPAITEMILYEPKVINDIIPYITDEPLNSISGNINSNLPTSFGDYTILWSSSNVDILDPSTGVVKTGENIETVVLTADFTDCETGSVFSKDYNLTVIAEDKTETITVDKIDSLDNDVSENNSIQISPVDSVNVHGKYCQEFAVDTLESSNVRLDFEDSDGRNVYSYIYEGGNSYFEVNSARYKINASDSSRKELLLKTDNGYISLYCKNNGVYRTVLYNLKLSGEAEESAKISITSDGLIRILDYKLKIDKDTFGNIFEKQMTLDRISTESPFKLSMPLSLSESFLGVSLEWSSSNENIINSNTGQVNVSNYKEMVTLDVSVEVLGSIFKKSFYFPVGLDNLSFGTSVSSSASCVGTNIPQNLTDEDFSTSYKTKMTRNYAVTLTASDEIDLTDVYLFEDTSEGEILSSSLYAGSSGDNLQCLYTGETVGSIKNVKCNITGIKVIKLVVNSARGVSGIKEIFACYNPTNKQRAENDLQDITVGSNLKDSFPQNGTGKNGSAISFVSDNPNVVFELKDGLWQVSVTPVDYSVSVRVTAKTAFRDAESTKVFVFTLAGSKSFDNSSSPSGGGGGTKGSGAVYNPPAETNSGVNKPSGTAYDNEINNHWGKKEIKYLIDNSIVVGNGETLNLDGRITRAEFAAMLVRTLGLRSSDSYISFGDVGMNDWFYEAIKTAYENGIMTGFGGYMNPNSQITREEMAKMIVCALKADFGDLSTVSFTDMNNASEWAAEYIIGASNAGLLTGYSDGTFLPAASLRRDEAMAVIYRCCMYLRGAADEK